MSDTNIKFYGVRERKNIDLGVEASKISENKSY